MRKYNFGELKSLLKTVFFQQAIFFASESLYQELKRNEFDYGRLDEKVRLSLQKYLNRMCFRPTPFGMFSAFSSLNWNVPDQKAACVVDGAGKIHVSPDFQVTAEIARQIAKSEGFDNIRYFLNTAIYSVKKERRYLAQYYDSKHKKTDFFINSFESNRVLNKLLAFSKQGKTKAELRNWLSGFTDDADDANQYIDDLINEGILVPEVWPNMSGGEYFERLAGITTHATGDTPLGQDILAYKSLFDNMDRNNMPDLDCFAANRLYAEAKGKYKSMFYVAYQRESDSAVDKKYQDDLRQALYCLNKLNIDAPSKSLTDFAGRFSARYEAQEIPLLQAMDHEAGIGYQGLGNNLLTSELLDGIQLDLQSSTLNFNWTPVHEFFLSKLVEIRNDEPIVIRDAELIAIREQSQLKMPPSFSVVFRTFDDKVWVEQAGGCTATALLGRFTLFSNKVHEEAKLICEVEQKGNEDVIFAEISCFHDDHAANINAHANIRHYEIPIGVHSTYDQQYIVSLSDLYISVSGNHIFLRSRKLNKIVIPRLSSAFNYSLSELTVFRFLCDLQYQGLKYNFNFDLRALLPGLKYYPRVEYKNCILFPATWTFGKDDINSLAGDMGEQHFISLSRKIKLKRHFALTEGDNQLLFDQNDNESIALFLKVIRNKKHAILQEAFVEQQPLVKDAEGNPFTGQFIASVFSDEVIYPPVTLPPAVLKKDRVKRVYLPGDEWVYVKLYCHPAVSNGILTKEIKRLIASLKKQGVLKNWFFIRYADPESHLRIRIRTQPGNVSRVVQGFERSIRKLVEKGTVNNMMIDTYKRELERYGDDTIEDAEQIFSASSDLAINYLKNADREQAEFSESHLAIVSVDALLSLIFRNNAEKAHLLGLMHDGMKPEFDDGKQVKFQLDTKYREYSPFFNNLNRNKPAIISLSGKKEFEDYLLTLKELKAKVQNLSAGRMSKLAADLVHMHLNRLFNDRQRNHEFIIYYLLSKYYLSIEARKGKGLSPFTPTFKGFSVNQVEESVLKSSSNGKLGFV
jgi:thiopeptide-type bacteriocin biosynthesis protein